jgi:AhpD family alkylhydroperoxidase
MSARLLVRKHPEALGPLIALDGYVRKSGLEPLLIDLVYMRVSQMNGCAFCMDMHSKDALKAGENARRLFVLSAWRETGAIFTARERTALAWAEAVTHLGAHGVPQDIYDAAVAEFGEKGLMDLDMAVISINAWNRLGVPFTSPLPA